MGQKVRQFISAMIFVRQFVICGACAVHRQKFATRGYIIIPPNVVCVTTLPCTTVTMSFFSLNFIHSVYFSSNNCKLLSNNF